MRMLPARIAAVTAGLLCLVLNSCESTGPKKKPRPPLPGEEVNELGWSRPTGPSDVATPYGLPMSR